MSKIKPKVGDILWMVDSGNLARYNKGDQREVIVKKVGRKYFSVESKDEFIQEAQFRIEDWGQKTDYSAYYVLYLNKQEWVEGQEIYRLSRMIEKKFKYGLTGLSYDTVKKIASLCEVE